MATMREITNRVLQVLGEDEIPTGDSEVTDKYQKLVYTFVNQIKEEVEDATNWRALKNIELMTLLVSTDNLVIAGTNDRTRLLREYNAVSGIENPICIDVTNPDAPQNIREQDLTHLLRDTYLSLQLDDAANAPSRFALDSDPATGAVVFRVRRPLNLERSIYIALIQPQDRFDFDDIDTHVKVPARPIEMGALWYALEERGEELGVNGVFSQTKYRDALDDAVSKDQAEQGGLNLVPT